MVENKYLRIMFEETLELPLKHQKKIFDRIAEVAMLDGSSMVGAVAPDVAGNKRSLEEKSIRNG